MSGWSSATRLRRAFLTVLALRYVPTGLTLPVLVLLMIDRGLDLAEVGLAIAAMSAVVLILEVPSGGLADAVGSRVVLAFSSVLAAASLGLLLLAQGPTGFLVAFAVMGLYRALDSGPLEAWYVDAALQHDPDRPLERDLSAAGAVAYGATALGAIGASVAAVLPDAGVSPVVLAVAAALVLEVVHLGAVLVLVREDLPRRSLLAVAREVRGTGQAITAAARLGWGARPLRFVLLVELGWGAGLAGVELLWQPRTDQLLTSLDTSAITGMMSAAGLILGALGSAALPLMLRLLHGRLALVAALLLGAQAVAVLVLGLTGLAGVIAGYLTFYALHGSLNSADAALLHRRTPSGRRATVLSLNSLVSRAGALPAAVALGALADTHASWAFLASAGLLLLAAPLYLASGETHGANKP